MKNIGSWVGVALTLAAMIVHDARAYTRLYLPDGYMKAEDNGLRLVVPDAQGGARAILGADGAAVESLRYDPYGATLLDSPDPKAVTRKYTGQERDNSTGLYNYNARQYDQAQGHFISADTIISYPGSAFGWNRFAYCRGDPVNYTDPSGHREYDEDTEPSRMPGSLSPGELNFLFECYYQHPGSKITDYYRWYSHIKRQAAGAPYPYNGADELEAMWGQLTGWEDNDLSWISFRVMAVAGGSEMLVMAGGVGANTFDTMGMMSAQELAFASEMLFARPVFEAQMPEPAAPAASQTAKKPYHAPSMRQIGVLTTKVGHGGDNAVAGNLDDAIALARGQLGATGHEFNLQGAVRYDTPLGTRNSGRWDTQGTGYQLVDEVNGTAVIIHQPPNQLPHVHAGTVDLTRGPAMFLDATHGIIEYYNYDLVGLGTWYEWRHIYYQFPKRWKGTFPELP